MMNSMEQDQVNVDATTSGPSMLSLMVEKHEAIEQTVSLIKKELTQDMISDLVPEQQKCTGAPPPIKVSQPQPNSEKEFDGLANLLGDSKIQSVIEVVAGNDTKDIIDKALVALKSSDSVDAKSKIFSEGIKKLHANLKQSDKSRLQNDPLFNLAIGLVGLRQGKKN